MDLRGSSMDEKWWSGGGLVVHCHVCAWSCGRGRGWWCQNVSSTTFRVSFCVNVKCVWSMCVVHDVPCVVFVRECVLSMCVRTIFGDKILCCRFCVTKKCVVESFFDGWMKNVSSKCEKLMFLIENRFRPDRKNFSV